MKITVKYILWAGMIIALNGCGSSGTAAGQDDNSTTEVLTSFSTKVIFPFYDHDHDREIWITDGTTDGTSLLKEINTQPRSAHVARLGKIGDQIFFQADDVSHGTELWVTDGTAEGMHMVKDIAEGHSSSSPKYFSGHSNVFCFRANDSKHGEELWFSDGTAEGTYQVKDIRKDGNSNPSGFVWMDDKVYFSAYDGIHGTELWVSDGTAEGTHLLKDINPGEASSNPYHMFAMGDQIFISANDGIHGTELWVSDGTEEGTQLLKDIDPNRSASPYGFVALGDQVYFRAWDQSQRKLWQSDGSETGTTKFLNRDGYEIFGRGQMTVIDQKIYFTAKDSNGTQGLWISDGSSQGTYLLKSGPEDTYQFVKAGNKIFFSAKDSVHGSELWVTDGTSQGTYMLKDIYAGSDSSTPGRFQAIGEKVYFTATDSSHGQELWVSDGTPQGTVMLKDIRPGKISSSIHYMTTLGQKIYFSANNDKHRSQLWVSDGTEEGTKILKLQEDGTEGIYPFDFWKTSYVQLDKKHYFSTPLYDEKKLGSTRGNALWVSDGTEAGTEMIATNALHQWRSGFSGLTALGDKVLMVGNDTEHGKELWVSDGTEVGTRMLKDIYEGVTNSMRSPSPFTVFEGKAYFFAEDKMHGRQIWVSDGTEEGTHILKEIPGDKNTASITVCGNGVFCFLVGDQIWESDGTESGTLPILDNTALNNERIGALRSDGNSLWAVSSEKYTDYYLWLIGENNSTKIAKLSDNYDTYRVMGEKIYFIKQIKGTESGLKQVSSKKQQKKTIAEGKVFELWSNDGTAEGSKKLHTFRDCARVRFEPKVLSHRLIIYEVGVNYGVDGLNIWTSDGTEENTTKVVTNAKGGYISGVIDDEVLLNVYQKETMDLYRTDGTVEGTHLLKRNRW